MIRHIGDMIKCRDEYFVTSPFSGLNLGCLERGSILLYLGERFRYGLPQQMIVSPKFGCVLVIGVDPGDLGILLAGGKIGS